MECYISLGANLGERERTLRKALEKLHGEAGVKLCRVSGFYETEPWGKKDQPAFVNAAAKVRTDLAPLELLRACQRIEGELGRVRQEHWGARSIDLDLLCVPGVQMDTTELKLPHPYMTERSFVLVPLEEIAPDLVVGEQDIRQHRRACMDAGMVSPCCGSPTDYSMKLIACVDEHGGLGRNGRLLFHLPEDMAFFRQKTLGGTVIMGRRTMESLGKPLEGRRNILLSRKGRKGEGFETCRGLEELWQALHSSPEGEVYVIGGGEIYAELLPYCLEAWITRVKADGGADVFLEDFRGDFSLVSCSPAVSAAGYGMEFCHYVRKF